MTKINPTARELAQDVTTLLEWHDVNFPRIAAELRRVLNVSLPIAEVVYHGYVRTLSSKGRRHLEDGLIEMGRSFQVLSHNSSLGSAPFPTYWDAVRDLGEYTEDEVPTLLISTGEIAKEI